MDTINDNNEFTSKNLHKAVNWLFLQASELVTVKAKCDELEGQKGALEDHIHTLKVVKLLTKTSLRVKYLLRYQNAK